MLHVFIEMYTQRLIKLYWGLGLEVKRLSQGQKNSIKKKFILNNMVELINCFMLK